MDQVPFQDLRPEFRAALEGLKASIFGSIEPKSIDGKPLNGPTFGGLLQAYVAAMNSGQVPTISTAWEGVSQQVHADKRPI